MQRLIALLIILFPGFLAALGIKLMRDMFFGIAHPPFSILWLQFSAGLLLFIIGLSFIGGFILHRDRKRNKVQPRFKKNGKKSLDNN